MKLWCALLAAGYAAGCAQSPPLAPQVGDVIKMEDVPILSVKQPQVVSGIVKTWTVVVVDGGDRTYDLYVLHLKPEGEVPRSRTGCSVVAEARLIDGSTLAREIDEQTPVFVPSRLVCGSEADAR